MVSGRIILPPRYEIPRPLPYGRGGKFSLLPRSLLLANRRLRRWYENTRLHEEWAMDPLEKIQYIYRNLAREFKKERKLWRQIIGAGGFNYLVHPSQRSIMLGLVRCFREILQDGQRQNLISRQYPVELLAGYLNSAQSQLCMEWVMDWPNSYALARRLQTTLRLFFSGISAP